VSHLHGQAIPEMKRAAIVAKGSSGLAITLGLLVVIVVGAQLPTEIIRKSVHFRMAGDLGLARLVAMDAVSAMYWYMSGGVILGGLLGDRELFGPRRVLLLGLSLLVAGTLLQPFEAAFLIGGKIAFGGRGMVTMGLLLVAHRATLRRPDVRDATFALMAASAGTASALAGLIYKAGEASVALLYLIGGGACVSAFLGALLSPQAFAFSPMGPAQTSSRGPRRILVLVCLGAGLSLLWAPEVFTIGAYSNLGLAIDWSGVGVFDFSVWENALDLVLPWVVIITWWVWDRGKTKVRTPRRVALGLVLYGAGVAILALRPSSSNALGTVAMLSGTVLYSVGVAWVGYLVAAIVLAASPDRHTGLSYALWHEVVFFVRAGVVYPSIVRFEESVWPSVLASVVGLLTAFVLLWSWAPESAATEEIHT